MTCHVPLRSVSSKVRPSVVSKHFPGHLTPNPRQSLNKMNCTSIDLVSSSLLHGAFLVPCRPASVLRIQFQIKSSFFAEQCKTHGHGKTPIFQELDEVASYRTTNRNMIPRCTKSFSDARLHCFDPILSTWILTRAIRRVDIFKTILTVLSKIFLVSHLLLYFLFLFVSKGMIVTCAGRNRGIFKKGRVK